jgi:DNA-binding NarL/FixJ family response regulator
MSDINILILDEDRFVHMALKHLIKANFGGEVTSFSDIELATVACKQKVFSLIIVDPMCPDSFAGEKFVREQRQFYSINVDTPIIMFTEDIEFVLRISEEFGLHPETKLGPVTKILNPIKFCLDKKR